MGSKFGEATMWWGIVLHVYIKQIGLLKLLFYTAKSLYIFSLKINQLIHRTRWVDSVCSFMRIPFSTDTQGSAENRSWVVEFLKNVFTRFKHHEKLVSVESLCKEESDRLASVLNIKTEQVSFLIGWIAVAMVTEEEFASIAYLKTGAPSVDQLYYHKFCIRSVDYR